MPPYILTTIFHQSPQVSTSFHELIPINHRQLQLQLTSVSASASTWTSASAFCEHLARPCGSLRKLLAARCSLHAARTQWLISISPPLPTRDSPTSNCPPTCQGGITWWRLHLNKKKQKQKQSEHCVNLWARTYREGTLRKTVCLAVTFALATIVTLADQQCSIIITTSTPSVTLEVGAMKFVPCLLSKIAAT